MKKYLIAIVMALLPMTASASGGAALPLDHIEVDYTNKGSLQRGMATFVNRCMGCHSAQYQRFERAAQDLEIPNKLVEDYLIFDKDKKIGEHMTIGMAASDAKVWFGNPPPDLTLEARLRGADWVYTYLRAFYQDPSRPWGVNNAVFKDVGMPNVLADLQGVQKLVCSHESLMHHGIEGDIDPLTGARVGGCLSHDAATGSLTAEEFDKVIYDLVNFMAYMAEPSKADSHRIGTYVLLFLFFFFFLAYALKREYWKDVH